MENDAVITDTGMNVCIQDLIQAPLQDQTLPQSNPYQVMTLVAKLCGLGLMIQNRLNTARTLLLIVDVDHKPKIYLTSNQSFFMIL